METCSKYGFFLTFLNREERRPDGPKILSERESLPLSIKRNIQTEVIDLDKLAIRNLWLVVRGSFFLGSANPKA